MQFLVITFFILTPDNLIISLMYHPKWALQFKESKTEQKLNLLKEVITNMKCASSIIRTRSVRIK